MKYRGRVEGGIILLDETLPFLDGTFVEVEPVASLTDFKENIAHPRPGSAQAVLRHAGIWMSESDEVDRLLAELRDAKQAELQSQVKFGGQEAIP